MKAQLVRTKRVLAAGTLAAVAILLTASGVHMTSAAYRDDAFGASASTDASVPMTMFAGRQSKLVDTALAIGADQKAYVWGRVGNGGDAGAALTGVAADVPLGGADGYPRKVQLPGDPNLIEIAADRRTAIAISESGQLYAWGAGSYLVPGSTSDFTINGFDAQMVSKADGTLFTNAKMIAAAERNAAIIVDTHDQIWRWGNPTQGGVAGYLPQPSDLPASELGIPASVTGGQYFLSTVLDNGNVYVWGSSNHMHELPGNQRIQPSDEATLVEGLQPWSKANNPNKYVVQVGFGGFDYGFGVALLSDNTLLAWGETKLVAGHENPTVPTIIADNVLALAPNFYGVSFLKTPLDPTSAGYDLWGYGPPNYSLGYGGDPMLVDTDVSSIQPGMGFFFWMTVNGRGEDPKFFGRGYNPQGAVGLNAGGTAPYVAETVIREITFVNKNPDSLNFLAE